MAPRNSSRTDPDDVNVHLNLYVPRSLYEKWDRAAKREGRSLSNYVVQKMTQKARRA